jgi:cell division protease FtsH
LYGWLKAMMAERTEQQREETAYHEAGHAVMGFVLRRYPQSISIIPDGTGAVGKTEFDKDAPKGGFRYFDDSDAKRRYIRIRVLIEVAGTIAHDLKFPGRDHDQGDAHDNHWARELIVESVSWEDDHEVYLERTKQEATLLLKENWHLVEAVAGALLQWQTLTRAGLLQICGS